MPVESAADRASFLSADEHAAPARYTAPGGGTAIGPFTLIYDKGQARNRFVAKDQGATTSQRTAWICADDVPVLDRDGTLEVGHFADDGVTLVVDETLTIRGLPERDETGAFWHADLTLVD